MNFKDVHGDAWMSTDIHGYQQVYMSFDKTMCSIFVFILASGQPSRTCLVASGTQMFCKYRVGKAIWCPAGTPTARIGDRAAEGHHTTPHHTTPHHGNQRRMNGSPKRKHSRNKPRTPHYATPHQTTRQSQLHAATQKTHTHSTKRKL